MPVSPRKVGAAFLLPAMPDGDSLARSERLISHASLCRDVRDLIAQDDRGKKFFVEVKGTSDKVLTAVVQSLSTHLGRSGDAGLAGRIHDAVCRFYREVPAENIHLRLSVGESVPDFPRYDPFQVTVWDGERDPGSGFSTVVRHLTLFGTKSSVANVTDIGELLERGKKKCLILCLGTNKDEDARATAPEIAALNALVHAAGPDPQAILTVAEMLEQEGPVPESLRELAEKISELRLLADAALDDPGSVPVMSELKTQIDALLSSPDLENLPDSFARTLLALRDGAESVLIPDFTPAFPEIETNDVRAELNLGRVLIQFRRMVEAARCIAPRKLASVLS